MLGVKFPGEVDPGLGLVFGGVFFGVGVQDGPFRLARCRQRDHVGGIRAIQQPGDHPIFAS